MKKEILIIMTALLFTACSSDTNNPFYKQYENEYGAPPFEAIKTEHYMPAFKKGIKQQQEEIDAIAKNTAAPTFANTIEAIEYSGELLSKVSSVFFNLLSAKTDAEMQKIAKEVSPILSEHSDDLYMNDKIFNRVKTLYDKKEALSLRTDQKHLLEKYYKNFVRAGATLDTEGKNRLREINKELNLLQLSFGQNVLAETNAYKKIIDKEEDLIGLPDDIRQAAAEAATAAGEDGKWLFTTQKASFLPVMQQSANRDLRRELFLAYSSLGNNNNENDNKETIQKIIKLRVERAHLLGFDTPADYILEDRMAKTPENVYKLMDEVWPAALRKAKQERGELQTIMDKEGKGEKLQAWDWWYYSEKLKEEKYALDEEALRPYFKLENVRRGAFSVATKLYGLEFNELKGMPIYHPEVEVFEVKDADGSLIGVLYTDYFPRESKRAGAWMNNYVRQYKKDGVNYRPIIVNVGNFVKPTADKPSLLTPDNVETLFHEFGHALHGLLSQCTYPSIAGTKLPRDFVEMPSQVFENWCFKPEVLKEYAFHYETGEVIPQALIDKIQNASTFNQGFEKTELLAATLLDLKYHTRNTTDDFDVEKFEKETLDEIGLIPEIIARYRSTYFSHIFTGGYACGYYGYTWSAVLDAHAFQAFEESGDIFNQKVATAFRKEILERGESDEPMQLYLNFRGVEPDAKALIKRSGL